MDGGSKQRASVGRNRRGDEDVAAVISEGRWHEVFTRFVATYKGAPLSIRVVEADGSSRALDPSASVELRLMSIGEEVRKDARVVVLFVHKYPGAQIAQIEFSHAVHLEQDRAKLTVEAADGCRMEVHASGMGALRR